MVGWRLAAAPCHSGERSVRLPYWIKEKAMGKTLAWDLSTRVFYSLLVASFAAAYLAGASEKLRDLHAFLGYLMP